VCIYVYGGIQLTFQYTIISIIHNVYYTCARNKHGTITDFLSHLTETNLAQGEAHLAETHLARLVSHMNTN
jgi:hypothetical protein